MKIKIYFHVTALEGWEEFINEKVGLMYQSGLWKKADEIWFKLHYPDTEFGLFIDKWSLDSRIKFWVCNDSIKPLSEVYSQRFLLSNCLKETEPVAIFRYHTKGLSYKNNPKEYPIALSWCRYLDYWNIIQWREAYSALLAGYDTSGCGWHPLWNAALNISGHYSGNIWWANSEYIKKLPMLHKPHEINSANQLGGFSPRHDSELWIGASNPTVYELHHYEHAVVNHVAPPTHYEVRRDTL